MRREKQPTPIEIDRGLPLLTDAIGLWRRVFATHMELWRAVLWVVTLGLLLFGISRILPYLPFFLPETLGVPVTQVAIPGPHRITVIRPKLIVIGQPFQISFVYEQTASLPQGTKEIDIRIIPSPSAVIVQRSHIIFPASERLPNLLSQEITVYVPIIDPLPKTAYLELTIVFGDSEYSEKVEMPLVVLPQSIIHLTVSLVGLLSVQSLWMLIAGALELLRYRNNRRESRE